VVSDQLCQRFLARFAGRPDVYAVQWVNERGRKGYAPR